MNAEEGAGKERGEGDVGEREEEGRKGHGRKGMRRSGRRVGKVIALGEHDDQPLDEGGVRRLSCRCEGDRKSVV